MVSLTADKTGCATAIVCWFETEMSKETLKRDSVASLNAQRGREVDVMASR